VEEDKIVVLLVDEGQKLGSSQIEALRTLLNFETNEFKLLQLVILAQLEFLDLINEHKNFFDRINFSYTIRPLTVEETKSLIEYRLKRAGREGTSGLFNEDALRMIHMKTRGFPRKIIKMCHHALISMYAKNKNCIDLETVQSLESDQILMDDDLVSLRRSLRQFARTSQQTRVLSRR